LIAQGQADNLSKSTINSMDKKALLMLREVIEKTLARIPSPRREPEPEPEPKTEPALPRAKTPPFTLIPETPSPASPVVFSTPTIDELQTGEPQTDGPGTETVASEKPDDGDTIVDEDVEMLL
jgi:hypothetical protein